ncbi:MAG: class I SAM-dependent methyltransferase [Acidobacteria bacterium]|nr:class I SAM-dependent methyltransferase [Acidobacteriota bacterium]
MSSVSSSRHLARRVSCRYGSDFLARYVYWKIRLDPVYEEVGRILKGSDLPLLDLGCGAGLLAFYLRESGYEAAVTGFDLDEKKIARAREVAQGYEKVGFETKLVDTVDDIPGHVTLLDVVHYLEDHAQTALLRSVANRVRPGATVVLRETLADGSWRARVTWLEEAFARATGWMRTTTINFPKLESIDHCFPEVDFTREATPLWGRTPFNSYLLTYVRR